MNRRAFLLGGAAVAVASAAGTVGYTLAIEPHWLDVVHRDLPIASLPATLRGARLVQVSDVHVGPDVDDDFVIESLGRVNALQPDILVITGDLLTFRPDRGEAQFAQLRRVLGTLRPARLATVGILGNHDYGVNWSEAHVAARVHAELERAGVRVLRNECATVEGLDIVGVDDLWADRCDPERALAGRSGAAALALCHNPDALDARSWGDYRGWVLAGHTHGGQCKPPFLPPPLLPVRNRRYPAGEIDVAGGRRLYISRGVGHLLQARFNVRPEITAFTLTKAADG